MKPKSQPSLQISFLPKLCGPGMWEGGIWKCSGRGATMAKFFLKFGLSFFQGYFFHPTMWEGGIRKCSERGAIMDKFFWSDNFGCLTNYDTGIFWQMKHQNFQQKTLFLILFIERGKYKKIKFMWYTYIQLLNHQYQAKTWTSRFKSSQKKH